MSLGEAASALGGMMTLARLNMASGVWSGIYVARQIAGLSWSLTLVKAMMAKLPNLDVQLARLGATGIDMLVRSPNWVRRIGVENKGWNFDRLAHFPAQVQGMLVQLASQSQGYAALYGDDLVYAFKQLPSTPAGQAVLRQVQQILVQAGVRRITFGGDAFVKELELMLK